MIRMVSKAAARVLILTFVISACKSKNDTPAILDSGISIVDPETGPAREPSDTSIVIDEPTDTAAKTDTDAPVPSAPESEDTEEELTDTVDTSEEEDKDLPPTLFVAPLIYSPTDKSFEVNAVLASGDPTTIRLYIQMSEDTGWVEVTNPRYPASDIVEWSVTGLSPSTVYPYAIVTDESAVDELDGVVPSIREAQEIELDAGIVDSGEIDGGIDTDKAEEAETDTAEATDTDIVEIESPDVLFVGDVVTQRGPGESFSFALLADTHIRPRELEGPGLEIAASEEQTLLEIANDIDINAPDFLFHLGDMLDFHDYGFNDPPPNGEVTRWGYINYRRMLDDMIGSTPHFLVIGNWEGENGDYSAEVIARSRDQRLLYAPGPEPTTYPQGGSPYEDYYAFTWGDAIFIVLNVMSYTPTPHLLSTNPGLADDWTLGEEQMEWFKSTLSNATSKWRFVLIHHTVGGSAGDMENSAYGRGGGRAAYVGEQAVVHELMLDYGVQIFFYGHDHVFTDMVVDDIHYTLPGSAGAIWKFVSTETGYTDYSSESGHGFVTVTPENVLVEFLAQGGGLIDSFVVK